MKPNTSAILAALGLGLGLVSSASAAVTLLTDNFNSEASFTATSNADQAGLLAGSTYDVHNSNGTAPNYVGIATRGAGSLVIAPGTDRSTVYTNADYISFANTYNTAIQFSFDYSSAQTGTGWVGFILGIDKTAWVDSPAVPGNTEFSALFRNNGTGSKWVNGTAQGALTSFTYPQTIKLELRGTDGGSAFDNGGSVAQIWAGTTDLGTYTLDQLTTTNGYFGLASYRDGGTGGTVDNFSITATVPEPSAALLGGLGLLALLRRRR